MVGCDQHLVLENVERCGGASSKLLIYYFVMAQDLSLLKSSPEINTCQPFLQPWQLTWLHMRALSFTPKSRAKILAFMSAIYAWSAT